MSLRFRREIHAVLRRGDGELRRQPNSFSRFGTALQRRRVKRASVLYRGNDSRSPEEFFWQPQVTVQCKEAGMIQG